MRNEHEPFERILVERLMEFVREDLYALHCDGPVEDDDNDDNNSNRREDDDGENKEANIGAWELAGRDLDVLEKARRAGVVHLIGENEVVAGKGAGIWKRVLIDYAYNLLKRNLRQSEEIFDIPHKRMLKVGMTNEL